MASQQEDESKALIEFVSSDDMSAAAPHSPESANRVLPLVLKAVQSPTDGNSSICSNSSFPASTKKKRPPSLFGSTVVPPSCITSPQAHGQLRYQSSPSVGTPLTHTPTGARMEQQQQLQQPRTTTSQGAPTGACHSGPLGSPPALKLGPLAGHTPVGSDSKPTVAISADGKTLFVGEYRVTRDGCQTLRSHLLVNPKGATAPKFPDPSATPPLKSTLLEEPLSPIAYSMDVFPMQLLPPAAAPTVGPTHQVPHAGGIRYGGGHQMSNNTNNNSGTAGGSAEPSTATSSSDPTNTAQSSSSTMGACNASINSSSTLLSVGASGVSGHAPTQPAMPLPTYSHPSAAAAAAAAAIISPELAASSSTTVPGNLSPIIASLGRIRQQSCSSQNHSFSSYPPPSSGGFCLRYHDLIIGDTPFEAGASGCVFEASHAQQPDRRFAVKRIRFDTLFPYLDFSSCPTTDGTTEPSVPQSQDVVGYSPSSLQPMSGSNRSCDAFHSPQQGGGFMVRDGSLSIVSPPHAAPLHRALQSLAKHRQMVSILHRELRMLHSEYRSAHVVKIYNAFFVPELMSLDIVMEFMDYGCLHKLGRLLVHTPTTPGSTALDDATPDAPTGCGQAVAEAPPCYPDGSSGSDDDDASGQHSKAKGPDPMPLPQRMPLPERILAIVAEQVLRGIHDMHQRGHVHRDIKPDNILVNHQGIVKLSDFGLLECVTVRHNPPACKRPPLKPAPPSASSPVGANSGDGGEGGQFVNDDDASAGGLAALCSGTNKYMSPERHRGEAHGKPSDIWAFGVSLAECALGRYPVDLTGCADEFERMDRMRRIDFRLAIQETARLRRQEAETSTSSVTSCPPSMGSPGGLDAPLSPPCGGSSSNVGMRILEDLSPSCIDFIQQCLAEVPEQRPCALMLQKHPFLSQWNDKFDFAANIQKIRLHTQQRRRRTQKHARSQATDESNSPQPHEGHGPPPPSKTNDEPHNENEGVGGASAPDHIIFDRGGLDRLAAEAARAQTSMSSLR